MCVCVCVCVCVQDEYDDEDQWTPSKAAGVCLMLISSCVCNDIIVHVQDFIKENIANPDWKLRDAAAFTLGVKVVGRGWVCGVGEVV